MRNCHIISPEEGINGKFDVLIQGGVIVKMGIVWQHVRECVQYDLSGKLVTPGFFDMHVHFREPGETHKETIQSGSLAAAYGGFTGVLMMPNTKPPLDNPQIIYENKEKSEDNMINVYTSACATKGRAGKEISDIDLLINAGAIAITDDGSPVENDAIMDELFCKSQELGFPVVQHCEVMSISDGGVVNKGRISNKLKIKGIPPESEYRLIERDLNLLSKYPGARYHVQHISTKESVELVRSAKRDGLNVTSEVCPHHFILTEDAIEIYGTNAKMNPPLRTDEDINEILKGLQDGTIDVICTDHAPHSDEEKAMGLDKAPFGIIGLETAISLSYEYLVNKGIISFEELVMKMSVNPRKILKLPQIRISEGEKANLTVINSNWEGKIQKSQFHSKSRNTPFDGWEVSCRPEGIVNGEKFIINV